MIESSARFRKAANGSVSAPEADDFFSSRSGVCVYVAVGQHRFRVQFADLDARGIVTEREHPDAALAASLARVAVQKHRLALTKLFEEAGRRKT